MSSNEKGSFFTRSLNEAAKDPALREFRGETFHVERLTNGYSVFAGIHGQATFCPDIPAILAYIARAIGGEDAVPVMPVSPEEAGLLGGEDAVPVMPVSPEEAGLLGDEQDQIELPLCGTDVDAEIETFVKGLVPLESDENPDMAGIARAKAVFSLFGINDLRHFLEIKGKLMPELKLDMLSHLRGTKDTGKTV